MRQKLTQPISISFNFFFMTDYRYVLQLLSDFIGDFKYEIYL